MEVAAEKTGFKKFVSWTIYPFSWLILIAVWMGSQKGYYPLGVTPTVLGAILILVYLGAEFIIPYEPRWSMTLRSFLADAKYLVSTGAFTAIISTLLGYFAITAAGSYNGFASHWPFFVQLAVMILVYDGINYALHRWMHEGKSKFGHFLWMVHAAHHLPPTVYVMMHAVFHPLNVLTNNVVIMIIPVYLMGYNPEVIALFVMINSLQGLISHFNVDVRLGWLNYLVVATELHRYHHSVDVDEAKNYAGIIPYYDLLFGTFVYKPGVPPKALGISEDAGLPHYGQYVKILALPFRKA
jgi:sterol desaturase/sphingolipid hydroxylase (fatty acid hydroxylase superfamily)